MSIVYINNLWAEGELNSDTSEIKGELNILSIDVFQFQAVG